jgi:quercetin dioxygenase-like cupin family protein
MIIKDNEGNLLAIILRTQDTNDSKFFATENDSELQLASFKLQKGEEILRHYHPKQERKINLTSEVLVVTDGKIKVEIYDNNLELNTTEIINKGEVVALYNGGHRIIMVEDSKFIEVKQGPYDPNTDKKHF